MLLITRREDETVIINEEIEVTVVEVRGGRVKLGFNFPEGSTVYRKELFLKIQEENKQAADSINKVSISQLLNKIKNNKKEE